MRRAIVTRSDINIQDVADLTHPIMERYASMWGADFVVLTSSSPADGGPKGARSDKGQSDYIYRIVTLQGLLGVYDRILSLDTDIVINKNCPNMFDVVPEDKIGTTLQDWGAEYRVTDYRRMMADVQAKHGQVGWVSGYPNTGVFVLSKCHAAVFDPFPDGTYWEGDGLDDVGVGWQIHKHGFSVHELPFQYNHMPQFSTHEYGHMNRFDSFMIHWSGGWGHKLPNLTADIKAIYGDKK